MPPQRRSLKRFVIISLPQIDLFFKRDIFTGIKSVFVKQQQRKQP